MTFLDWLGPAGGGALLLFPAYFLLRHAVSKYRSRR